MAKPKIDTTATTQAHDRASAILVAAQTAALDRRAELASALEAEAAAKRAVEEAAEPTTDLDDALDAAIKRTRSCQIRADKSSAEEANARDAVEALEREQLRAEFDRACEASGDRALRAQLEEVIRSQAAIRAQGELNQQALFRAVSQQHVAVDAAHEIGARLGMSDAEVSTILRRQRGPIGGGANADLSEKRPPGHVNAWVDMLAEAARLAAAGKLPQIDPATAAAMRTGAPRTQVVEVDPSTERAAS